MTVPGRRLERSVLLVDYSTARPAPATIKAVGYSGVVRYLSLDPAKNLSPAERDELLAAGLSISLVWETTATRSSEGSVAGASDCRAAEAQARVLGYPARCPIFYAVDFDTPPAAVALYFAGISSVSTYPIGVYGSARVVEGISNAPWKWQAAAWSAGRVSPLANLYQRVAPTVADPIAGTDENVITADFPRWTSLPAPTPVPAPGPPSEENMLRILHSNPPQPAHWLSDGLTKRLITSTTAEEVWITDGVRILVLPQAEIDAIA